MFKPKQEKVILRQNYLLNYNWLSTILEIIDMSHDNILRLKCNRIYYQLQKNKSCPLCAKLYLKIGENILLSISGGLEQLVGRTVYLYSDDTYALEMYNLLTNSEYTSKLPLLNVHS